MFIMRGILAMTLKTHSSWQMMAKVLANSPILRKLGYLPFREGLHIIAFIVEFIYTVVRDCKLFNIWLLWYTHSLSHLISFFFLLHFLYYLQFIIFSIVFSHLHLNLFKYFLCCFMCGLFVQFINFLIPHMC